MPFNSLIARDWENPAERYMNIYKQYEDAECPLPDDGIAHFVYFARDRESLRNHEFLSNIRFQGGPDHVSLASAGTEPRGLRLLRDP